ncbi:RagB/SusD family nutrient uptake outer membrane protein [Chitinophaga sp. 22321]|uniref:RagB/SusD family nutrient uptake outer membrane protein n=1 Tax=Chitinophaga hostae TaxID=2831022 RepID=A0ABS5JAT9_9BACT|nr:RagB/SusD family nutrient uptake outer membrane protein [Chitinophaga hostae]MBS0031557.1 RagB/SusD family nutrient uptake outer membrane protein [Chitinophaga hostae]
MRKWYKIGIIICLLAGAGACKKFLEVKPLDTLSGKDFWKTKQDAQSAINGAYVILLNKFTRSILYNAGDFRPGNWNWFGKDNLRKLGQNLMLNTGGGDGADNPQDWKEFYQAIALANLCIDRIPGIEDPNFGNREKKALVAEARFLRAFIYFYIARMYGDVPLQTDPYDTKLMPREKMLTVLDFCLKDLETSKDDLPLSYDDPTNRAVRGTQGAALALMAHINMWAAGFDKANEQKYWTQTAALGKAVMDLNVYKLLPYTKETFLTIFKGRSEEGIFELSLDANYGGKFHSLICQWTLHEPYIHDNIGGRSEITPMIRHLDRIYPRGESDKRLELWFYNPYNTDQTPMFLKFSAITDPSSRDYDANLIFFRYADIILLRAEALAYLNQNVESIKMLNLVRDRAGAKLYVGGGGKPLQDAVFLEREKEMMGEGHLWYDLIRTGRISDKNALENSLTPEQMERGAWTWPISGDAVKNNPLVTRNAYWIQ